jgi:hypothetical protein
VSAAYSDARVVYSRALIPLISRRAILFALFSLERRRLGTWGRTSRSLRRMLYLAESISITS